MITHAGGTFFHQGADPNLGHVIGAGNGVASTSNVQANAEALAAQLANVGDSLKLFVVHDHSEASIKLVTEVDADQYAFATVTVTRGENDVFTLGELTRAEGNMSMAASARRSPRWKQVRATVPGDPARCERGAGPADDHR